MSTIQYICPQCQNVLTIDEAKPIAFCPYCANKIVLPEPEPSQVETPELTVRQFISDQSIPLATAVLPMDYQLSGTIQNQWQSEEVPFTAIVQAVNPTQDIILTSANGPTYQDYQSSFFKQAALTSGTIKSGLRDFVEPEVFWFSPD